MCVRLRAACEPRGRCGRRRGRNRTSGISGRGKICRPRQKLSHWQLECLRGVFFIFFKNKIIERIWMTCRSQPKNMGRGLALSLNCVGIKTNILLLLYPANHLRRTTWPMSCWRNREDILDGLSLEWLFLTFPNPFNQNSNNILQFKTFLHKMEK